ncbi:hypothetical protein [Cylindrospermum sp. FACHB-282]|nr:hypothetical protein [Cylindrospermum sp. FACHB-282]
MTAMPEGKNYSQYAQSNTGITVETEHLFLIHQEALLSGDLYGHR